MEEYNVTHVVLPGDLVWWWLGDGGTLEVQVVPFLDVSSVE